MKNFPSLLAVIGAWLCAFGFILPGLIAFIFASVYAIVVQEDINFYTLAFFAANLFAFFGKI